jgi:hypothetical protein
MKTANNYIVQNSGITALKIEYRKQICADINLVSGWNMVSIPLASANMTGSAIFPSATSLIYGYNNGYVSTTTLQNGNGYWVRYGANAVSNVCGNAIFFIPIPVTAGWNMIGGHHIEVSAGAIMTTPPGIINSAVYGFSNGYQQAYSLVPGKGYWVRVTQDGTITIPTPINASKNLYSTNNSTASGYIIIKDAADNSMTLYIGNENTSKDLYDLPPVPPVGIFDVRFGDNSSFSRFGINYINTQGLSYPITISASGVSLTLRDAVTNGKNFNAQVNSGNTFVLKSDIGQIEIESRSAPTDFALYQNYPNPFNPETKINFSLPVKGNVKLTVFNQLGEQAAVLADKSMDAGAHEMLWNASDLPSGIYYIELRANELRAVQKAVLIK